jgi:hypothetical protein
MTKYLKLVAFDGGSGTAFIKTEDGEIGMPAVGHKLSGSNVYTLPNAEKWRLGYEESREEATRFYDGTTRKFFLALLSKQYSDALRVEIEILGICLPISVFMKYEYDSMIKECFLGKHIVNGIVVIVNRVVLYGEGDVVTFEPSTSTLIIDVDYDKTDSVISTERGARISTYYSCVIGVNDLVKSVVTDRILLQELIDKIAARYREERIDSIVLVGEGAYLLQEVIKQCLESSSLSSLKLLVPLEPEKAHLRGTWHDLQLFNE